MDPKMVFKDVDQRLKYALRDNNNKGVIASSIIKDKKHSTHSAYVQAIDIHNGTMRAEYQLMSGE